MMMMQQEIEKMYGDGLKYYMAQTPDKFYMVMGPDSEQALKTLIDQPASAAASGDIKLAMDTLQNTPYNDFVCSINVIKLVKGGGEMMGSMGAQPGPGMEQVARMFSGLKDVQTQSCLAVGGSIADGQAAVRLAIPKQHLIEIVTAAMQLQQQAMATMQPQMQEAPTDSPITPQPQKAPKSPLSDWIGKPAPELKMVDLGGKAHRISRLKGKKVALDFWATWCPPCKKAIPDLIKLAGSNSSDLVILGLSDEPADTLTAFVKEAVPAPYSKVTAIPTLFLIDSEGIIRDVLVGHYPLEELQKRLNAMK
jgi:thiol-disulfide isomerase/thioredoxin